MSIWEEFSIELRIREILDVTAQDRDVLFGRPFLTPYQIAISFAEAWPHDTQRIGKPVGGKGTGQKDSLAQYFASELTSRIKRGELSDIEAGLLYRGNLRSPEYAFDDGTVEDSSGQDRDLSMFRIAADDSH